MLLLNANGTAKSTTKITDGTGVPMLEDLFENRRGTGGGGGGANERTPINIQSETRARSSFGHGRPSSPTLVRRGDSARASTFSHVRTRGGRLWTRFVLRAAPKRIMRQ